MHIVTLDVKRTHHNNPKCPSRIIRKPTGGWICADCGVDILHTRINTNESPLSRVLEDIAELDTVEGVLEPVEDDLCKNTPLYVRTAMDVYENSVARRNRGEVSVIPTLMPMPVKPGGDDDA